MTDRSVAKVAHATAEVGRLADECGNVARSGRVERGRQSRHVAGRQRVHRPRAARHVTRTCNISMI